MILNFIMFLVNLVMYFLPFFEYFSAYSSRPPELKSVEFLEISLSVFELWQKKIDH